MIEIAAPFVGSVAIAGLLVSLALWSRRRVRFKLMVLGLMAVFAVVHYVALVDLMSRPKPLALEWSPPDSDSTAVIASQMQEGVAIWLWMQRADAAEPRAYQLPWDENMARQLHEAKRQSEQTGGSVRMQQGQGAEFVAGERVFYADPQMPPPPKQVSGLPDSAD